MDIKPNFEVVVGEGEGRVLFSQARRFSLIAGPCQMESRDHAFMIAGTLKELCAKLGIGLVYKSSFDKANRTSLTGKRGIGLDSAMEIFADLKKEFGFPVLTDIHTEEQCALVAPTVDILQIPAFLCRQTDLLVAAAKTGRVINVKKGQFLAPWDMKNVQAKFTASGNPNVLLCERGVSFGYNTLVSDMRSLPIMAAMGSPVVLDATQSVPQPGGQGVVRQRLGGAGRRQGGVALGQVQGQGVGQLLGQQGAGRALPVAGLDQAAGGGGQEGVLRLPGQVGQRDGAVMALRRGGLAQQRLAQIEQHQLAAPRLRHRVDDDVAARLADAEAAEAHRRVAPGAAILDQHVAADIVEGDGDGGDRQAAVIIEMRPRHLADRDGQAAARPQVDQRRLAAAGDVLGMLEGVQAHGRRPGRGARLSRRNGAGASIAARPGWGRAGRGASAAAPPRRAARGRRRPPPDARSPA